MNRVAFLIGCYFRAKILNQWVMYMTLTRSMRKNLRWNISSVFPIIPRPIRRTIWAQEILHVSLLNVSGAANDDTYSVGEEETSVTEFEMFQQAVQPMAVDRTPRAIKILAGFCLLTCVVVINKLVEYSLFLPIFLVPISLLGGRAYIVGGSCVLTGQRCTKRKWRWAPWRPRQRSTGPWQFEL